MRALPTNQSQSTRLLAILLGGLLLSGCAPGGLFGERKAATVSDPAATKPDKDVPSKPAKASKPKTAVDKDAGSYSQQMAKGRSLENGGRWEDARTIYEKLAIDAPNRYEAFHRLGVVADHRRHFTDAQNYYAKALKLKPDDPEILNDLGYCYLLQGQLKQAETLLAKAVKAAPDNTRYRNNLGLIHGHQGRLEVALADFRRSGSEAEAQYNLAFVLAAKNDMEGAKQCFKQALAAEPGFESARKALRSFERIEADPTILADYEENPSEGVRLVPYVESDNASGGEQKVQRAVATSNSPGANTRALQSQARSMMQERLSSTQER